MPPTKLHLSAPLHELANVALLVSYIIQLSWATPSLKEPQSHAFSLTRDTVPTTHALCNEGPILPDTSPAGANWAAPPSWPSSSIYSIPYSRPCDHFTPRSANRLSETPISSGSSCATRKMVFRFVLTSCTTV